MKMKTAPVRVTEHESLRKIADAIGTGGDLLAAARQQKKRPENVLGLLVRPLVKQEISIMEARGCRADDWDQVQVSEDFDPFRVRRTHFVGNCVIGRFTGEVDVIPGVRLPTGIYGSTLINCQVGNDCLIENVRFAANQIIETGAVVFDVGAITAGEENTFACGQLLAVGPETGGRELPVWAEINVSSAAIIAKNRADREGQSAVDESIQAYVKAITSPMGWVRRGAVIRNSTRIENAFIGPNTLVDRVTGMHNVALLSTPDAPVKVSGGAEIVSSVLQKGVRVKGSAIVRRSVLCAFSGADQHASVDGSLIGPNTEISKGEVTASLVGPFVGLHHQSLLIAAYWPEGKGNVAYGAMVGSNHTGRAPDQECWPGEGTFFGLGSSIKYPSDFSDGPYSIIGSGVSTLAQRMTLPFSLIATPSQAIEGQDGIPRAFNEIRPGWGLYANVYAINRMELKFSKRDALADGSISYRVLRPAIIQKVYAALRDLEAVREVKAIYLEQDIAGIGKNFLREESRQQGIAAYRQMLLRYALRVQLGHAEGKDTDAAAVSLSESLCAELLPGKTAAERLQLLPEIEAENYRIVEANKRTDFNRGQRIIDGYEDSHPSVEEDDVVQDARRRLESTEERVRAVLTKA